MGIMNYLIYKSMKKRNMSLNRSQSMTVGNRSQITAAAGQSDLTGTSNTNTGKRRHSARYLRHQFSNKTTSNETSNNKSTNVIGKYYWQVYLWKVSINPPYVHVTWKASFMCEKAEKGIMNGGGRYDF